MYDLEILDTLEDIRDPFAVTHNGELGLGIIGYIYPEGFTFWNGSRAIEVLTANYDASVGNGAIKFVDKAHDSVIVFREIRTSDKSLLFGDTSGLKTRQDVVVAATVALTQSMV